MASQTDRQERISLIEAIATCARGSSVFRYAPPRLLGVSSALLGGGTARRASTAKIHPDTVPKVGHVTGNYGGSFGTTYGTVGLRGIPRIRILGRCPTRAVWFQGSGTPLGSCSAIP
jgi:hypothetical protein